MQKNIFIGNLAGTVNVSGVSGATVARFTLISNEYAGKDKETGQAKERVVSIGFSAFGSVGTAIANNCFKGDQLIIDYRIENNNYEKKGEKFYSHNFVVQEFEFGSPGKEKRTRHNNGD